MENPHEILWEFTLNCNKNCCYCGSKNILKRDKEEQERNDYETIGQIGIAQYITQVHPNEVTITGGEPSCEYEELVKSVKILYNAGIKVKILTNGNLFAKMAGDCEIGDELDKMTTCYGLSINEVTDLDSVGVTYSIKDKTTIITNFGTHNINDFDKIAKFAMQYNCWQVQLTIGNEYQLDLDQIEELEEKLKKVESCGLLNIVRADNFTCGKCKAGIYGFSITYNGLIVPCLSYRSWKSNMMVQGHVTEIEEIWKNGFKFNRTRKFVPSCKTISGIEKLKESSLNDTNPLDVNWDNEDEKSIFEKINTFKRKNKDVHDVVFVYGVVNPNDNNWNTPLVYGVTEPNNIFKNTNFESLINKKNKKDKK